MLTFTVFGVPVPQGSMRAFQLPNGRPIITGDNKKTKPWRQEIALLVSCAMHDQGVERCEASVGIAMEVDFYFPRPKSLKKSVEFKVTRPDLDKLLRSLFDALKGVLYHDDSQVVDAHVRKHFDSPARMECVIREAQVATR